MKLKLLMAAIFSLAIQSTNSYAAPVPDQLLGKVTVRNSEKLGKIAEKELADIANRIKLSRNKGAVIITGDVPSAKSQEEYILKAVFTAKSVEKHLTSLLSGKYQVFVTAAKYNGKSKTRYNSVEIHLYPHELEAMEAGSTYRYESSEGLPKTGATVSGPQIRADKAAKSDLLSPPAAEDEQGAVTSKKERLLKERVEDPQLANELVNRAKARAAARARQLEQAK